MPRAAIAVAGGQIPLDLARELEGLGREAVAQALLASCASSSFPWASRNQWLAGALTPGPRLPASGFARATTARLSSPKSWSGSPRNGEAWPTLV